MRTTFNAMYREASAGIESATERLARFQRQVSTGLRVEKPSDDPAGTTVMIAEHGAIGAAEQYERAASTVGSRLTVMDTLLEDMAQKITAASVAALSARGSTQTAAQREAAAQTLESLKGTLVENLNATFQGTYLFGGAQASGAPFVTGGAGVVQPYAGSTSEVQVDIGKHRAVTSAMNGAAISQGGAARDVFATLDALAAAARAGDNDALGAGLAELDAALQRVTTAQSRVGMDMVAVDDQRLRLTTLKLAANARLDKVEAVDMAAAISGMNQAQAAYQAALGATAAVTRVSLMDYLK